MDQLSLFNAAESYRFPEELLEYREGFLSEEEANSLKDRLIVHTSWQQTVQKMYDRDVLTPRLIAWYGDVGKAYQLAGQYVSVSPWTYELLELKKRIEAYAGFQFNSVLLNYYRDGSDSVSWHRDKESELGNRPVIASVSLGQVRNFDFREVSNHQNKYSLPLKNGSLLLMKGDLQVNWEHRIAKSARMMQPRINLTFRLIRTLE